MAILRLDLEIDSDVYPELYARLAGIGRLSAMEEKLRQLAATGLVWELVRMHGPALADLGQGQGGSSNPGAGAGASAGAGAGQGVGDVQVRPEDLSDAQLPPARANTRAGRRAMSPKTAAVDLALDAPATRPGRQPLPPLHAVEVPPAPPASLEVPLNLPVLVDVVDEDGPLPPPLDVPSVTMATVVALRGDVEQPQVMDSGAEEPAPISLSPKAGRSSRLKRMKEKGLFQNG